MEKQNNGFLNILFIGKKDDFFSKQAAEYIKQNIPNTTIIYSARGEEMPEEMINWKGDYIISYLSQWIIPASLLENASKGGINLHPGSPNYPGIGCTNFAIYDDVEEFGITCHYMLPQVDTGKIIMVERFPIHKNDTVYSITQRAYSAILHTFYKLVDILVSGLSIEVSNEIWTKKPYTRRQLNDLCELTIGMKLNEKNKRIKASTFGNQKWAFINIEGNIFQLK